MRGLNDPLLVTSDAAPGIIKAIEVCFRAPPASAAKVPEDIWPDFKARVQAGLPGSEPRPCARARSRHRGRLRPGAGTWSCLLHGRLRSLHCAPAVPGDAPPGRSEPRICLNACSSRSAAAPHSLHSYCWLEHEQNMGPRSPFLAFATYGARPGQAGTRCGK